LDIYTVRKLWGTLILKSNSDHDM